MLNLRNLTLPFFGLLLVSCVTINIYFPAAAAEEAAREIVRDVLGTEGKEGAAPSESETETMEPQSRAPQAWLSAGLKPVLDLLVPPVQASEADININTPAISRLRASMRDRQRELGPYYRSGAIGLDRNALVSIRDIRAVPLQERNRLKKLVADENADRNALYAEIARANQHPEWEADIRRTFARVWVEEAPAGTWYQDSSGNWQRK